jgi:2,3-bisphosphoglycerate-independent phosphoglycerate mutase
MKVLLLVMDGAGDVGEKTPLSMARKPNMEKLARSGQVGLLDIGYRKNVDSDVGYLTLLGCFSRDSYPGRGYLEALAIPGLEVREGDVCIRGDFATLDSRGMITDRRAGRDETGLERFASLLDGMEIDGIRFSVRKSMGHRVVIVMRGRGLSCDVFPNDPKRTGVPEPQVQARSPSGKKTASALNRFLYRTRKILSGRKENRTRKKPANTILIRNLGLAGRAESLEAKYGMSGACVAGVAIAKGVARFLGMDVIDVPGATGMPETNLKGKFGAARKALEGHGLVFLHVNGTDIASHDRKPELKRKLIGDIDQELGKLIRKINLKETIVIVTCDHRTASSPGWKGYEHVDLPVPVLISGGSIPVRENSGFSEPSCGKGFRIKGNGLIGLALELGKGHSGRRGRILP